MGEPEVGYFRGQGGIVIDLTLPLAESLQHQVTRGQLVRVNPDGSTWSDQPEVKRPAVNASKNDWVGYAVSQGMPVDDADAMTKNDLIEKFGSK